MGKIVEEFDQIIIACNTCKHHFGGLFCAAFPKGIPDDILFGDDQHNEATADQENDIVYEKSQF